MRFPSDHLNLRSTYYCRIQRPHRSLDFAIRSLLSHSPQDSTEIRERNLDHPNSAQYSNPAAFEAAPAHHLEPKPHYFAGRFTAALPLERLHVKSTERVRIYKNAKLRVTGASDGRAHRANEDT